MERKDSDVIVIGAGPAGMMAAIRAAEIGKSVLLLERNKILGTKLLLSGKGRCNLTNAGEISEFIEQYIDNGRFLYHAFSRFFNQDLIDFFGHVGLKTKVERGGRVFPVSDRAEDICLALKVYLQKNKVKILFSSRVSEVLVCEGEVKGVRLENGQSLYASRVIVATGGLSYPKTGSTGDGYLFAKKLGQSIIPTQPGLVGLTTEEKWVKNAQGLNLKNVKASLYENGKKRKEELGEMVFTHFGVSGPIILKLSVKIDSALKNNQIFLSIDLKPGLTQEQLNNRLLREIQDSPIRHYKNFLKTLLPRKLIPVFVELSGINPEKKINQLTKKERLVLINLLKDLKLRISGARSIAEAIVTRGGISTQEINPKTMESKIIKGLYFCGEVIDVAGLSGGYNLQAAFSTGFVAGESSAS